MASLRSLLELPPSLRELLELQLRQPVNPLREVFIFIFVFFVVLPVLFVVVLFVEVLVLVLPPIVHIVLIVHILIVHLIVVILAVIVAVIVHKRRRRIYDSPIPSPFSESRVELEQRVLKKTDERGSGTRSSGSQYDLPGVQWGKKRLYSVDGSTEKVFEWQEMGIIIYVPAGVVSPDYFCEITISSVLAGNFIFPEECTLVSGVFAISTSCDILKPIRIHLQHCVNFSHGMEKNLTFTKADGSGRSPPYQFEICDGGIFTSKLQYQSLYGALECQKFSPWFFGIFTWITGWFNVRYKAQLLLNSRQWKAHVTITKDIVSLLQDCKESTEVIFSFADDEITVETEKESEDHQWEIKPLQTPCKIQRADVNAYGPGSERSIPKLSFILEPKPGCKARLYHEMKIKGATEPSLALYLSCSPASVASARLPEFDIMKKEPKHEDVFNLLKGHSDQYEGFGREFGIEHDTRIDIKTRAQNNREILAQFIDEWIEGSKAEYPVTWEFLVQTVLIERMELRALARKVKEFLNRTDIQDAYRVVQDWEPTE